MPEPIAATPRPLLVVLTGGIASGKTAVAELFAKLNVPVIDTDQIARDVVEPGTPALAEIATVFGAEVLDLSGRLDRRLMRDRVFADPTQRQRLEAILHPAIRNELDRRSLLAPGPYQIHVIPLFVEGGRRGHYDRVLVVDCPEQEQIRRLTLRDRSTVEQARSILAAQATREQRLSAADDVILNTGTVEDLAQAVARLHEKYALVADAQRV